MNNSKVFSYYFNLGYQVIPIHYQTKVPIFKSWNKNYDSAKLEEFVAKSTVPLNFGILLGEIVDIEGDCEKSNREIDELLVEIPHPVFQSRKSKHHLFRSRVKNLTRIVKNGIEFRGYKHQSIIPPSCHENGTKYEWITDVFKFEEIPFLPTNIHNYLNTLINQDKPQVNKKELKPHHLSVSCASCLYKFYLHQVRFEKELRAFKNTGSRWLCRKCRPTDLRDTIRNFNAKCGRKVNTQ